MSTPRVDSIMDDQLAQVAFTAYVDAALAPGPAHERLQAGSAAAARAVVATLIEHGYVREPRGPAVHGTVGGYDGGCRCEYCRLAKNLAQQAIKHWKKRQGHNKIRSGP